MKRFISTTRTPHAGKPAAREERRKGSILVIVIALLGMLLLLGVAFYTFASQEHLSSTYFSETYKERFGGLPAETFINYALEQLIVGPSATQTQSALYGRTHSLVGNMLGINADTVSDGFFDPVPYNGQGVNLALNAMNNRIVDQNFDGIDDGLTGTADPLNINFSAAANLTGVPNATETIPFAVGRPQPDVGYTYPDINNLFLAHISEPTEDVNGRRVIIPSFLRPQILRSSTGVISGTWPEDSGMGGKVLRPHPEHKIAGSNTLRFITSSTPETNVLGNPVNPFPFTVGTGRMGVWTGNADNEYDFDVDNDLDGTKEGIWLDLGFPAQTLIDGRRYVPMFSYTVLDADGLINLNTAGNLNQTWTDVGGENYLDAGPTAVMQTLPVSTSHLGASRSEVNPLWAMWNWTAPSLTADEQKEFKYFSNLTGSMSRLAIANMELIHIKNGQKRDDGLGGDEFNVGAWGELPVLQANDFTSPGRPDFDDDGDQDAGNGATTPLDLRGFGMTTVPTADGLIANLIAGPYGDPNRWLQYDGYLAGSLLPTAFTTNSLPTGPGETQIDEADETIVEPLMAETSPTIQADALFGPDEMLGLHLTNSEFTSVAGTSRLKKLAPINFASEAVRKQFTTTSFDRAEFGWTPSINRSWEFNADDDSDGLFEFPPAYKSLLANDSDEPFRDVLRNLLRVESDSNDTVPHVQFRLALNGLLTGYDLTSGRPTYRPLTDHNSGQEPTARSDRQLLARDIYVLLYSLGGGQDSVNYAEVFGPNPILPTYPTPPYPAPSVSTLYSNAQLREMAQFAVNLVDALDPDNVITQFEYDKDLSNGWGLDDNTITDDGGDRAAVFGVEAQQLTLSEWLAVRIPYAGTGNPDHPKTRFNDSSPTLDPVGTVWAYLELKSVSPLPIELNGWGWRIRKEGIGGTKYLTINGETNAVVAPGGTYVIGTTSKPELFNPTTCYSSDLRIDYDENSGGNANSYNRILPSGIETTESSIPSPTNIISPPPTSDLDLVYNYSPSAQPVDKFVVSDNPSPTPATARPVGDFFNPTTVPNPMGTEKVRLILERRSNLQAVVPQGAADPSNPWIAVDQMVIEPDRAVQTISLNFVNNSLDDEQALRFTGGTGNGVLRSFVSHERKEPLDRSDSGAEDDCTAGAGGTAGVLDFSPNSTLSSVTNSISPSAFTLWQPHFDREFSSTFELLSLPLYGPPESSTLSFDSNADPIDSGAVTNYTSYLLDGVTTNRLKLSQDPANSLLTASSPPMGLEDEYRGVELVASNKFLRPDYDNDADPAKKKFDNRWYRILSLVEVSTLTNNMVQWDQNSDGLNGTQWERTANPPRLPGAINLNTIRNRGVLASLIDDPDDPLSGSDPEGHLNPSNPLDLTDTYDGNRDWWRQFIISRDGLDSSVTNLYLPGLPGSRPYRNGSFVDQGLTSIQGSLLREVVGDGPFVADGRNLFEARRSEVANQIDYHTRHRLLRKVANNSTNRSNVFIVYMTIAFFEAVDDSASGNVRIGAQLTALPEHRGFAIVDRTLLEKAQVEASPQGRRFDYKKFIVYQKTLK